MDNNNYQEAVKFIRQTVSRQELATKIGVYPEAIKRYENGGIPQSLWTRKAIMQEYNRLKENK